MMDHLARLRLVARITYYLGWITSISRHWGAAPSGQECAVAPGCSPVVPAIPLKPPMNGPAEVPSLYASEGRSTSVIFVVQIQAGYSGAHDRSCFGSPEL